MIRPEMSPSEYEIWRELVSQRCGIYFTPSRQHFLQARLWERMQVQQIKSYNAYYQYVLYNPHGSQEWAQVLDLLLNNESSFFRHTPSFAALTDHVLPTLMREKRRQNMNMLSMWSAGCANGQEAYSLAMAFYETAVSDEARLWQTKVWGSDISQKSLRKAKNGRYKSYDVRTMPDDLQRKYMTMVTVGHETFYDVIPAVKRLVHFMELNFTNPDAYTIMGQDVIFCQNVLIYFQPAERLKIVKKLCQRLAPGGYLFLAPAEVVGLKVAGIQSLRFDESLVYQRTG
jgi:chemotaxis methyl-accepting protein methylase